MKLIVETGATKTEWRVVSPEREPVIIKTAGINLSSMRSDAIEPIVLQAADEFRGMGVLDGVDEVYLYAAGLVGQKGEKIPDLAKELDKVLTGLFPDARIEYASDMLSAARALSGHNPGIVGILGTGSNSCFYDGEKIVKNVPSGGFILGDEGGGARLGKLFISDFIKGLVPEPVAGEFGREFEVGYHIVVKNVYRGDAPSKYLGSFAPWILAHYDSSEYVRTLVEGNFRDFIETFLKQYDYHRYPIGIVGGFGYANRAILEKVAGTCGIKISTIIPAPMDRLVEYHLGRL